MVTAEKLKSKNIAEYLIHMFKSEDLVRTFEFDLTKLTNYVIANIPITEAEKKELILWYAGLIETMELEKNKKLAHTIEVSNLINNLLKLHTQLLTTDSGYKAIVSSAEPHIIKQIKESGNTVSNPIQICLNAMYGALLLKANHKIISADQQKMLEAFGDLLSFLSYTYKERMAGVGK